MKHTQILRNTFSGTSRSSHYTDVIMGAMASQVTSLKIVYSSIYWGTDQRKHQSSASLAFVRGIHREPVNSPHKWPVTRKMFPLDDVVMFLCGLAIHCSTVIRLHLQFHTLFWCKITMKHSDHLWAYFPVKISPIHHKCFPSNPESYIVLYNDISTKHVHHESSL